MSSFVQSEVWKRYPVGGGEFVLALALADHAQDDGTNIWPSVAYSARKTRQSERSVQLHLRRMVQRGFLLTVDEARYGRTREYKINPKWLAGGELMAPLVNHVPDEGENSSPPHVDKLSSVESGGCNLKHEGVKSEVGGGEIHDTKHAADFTPTSSNHQEKVFKQNPPPVDKSVPDFSIRQMFEIFIREYPKPERPADAWAEFNRLRPDMQLFGWIMRALALQKKSDGWNSEGGRWIPFPQNWLRKQQWKLWKSARVDQGGQWLRTLLGVNSAPVPEQRSAGFIADSYLNEIKNTLGKG